MIIQTTNLPPQQAIQPDTRAHAVSTLKPVELPPLPGTSKPSSAELNQAVAAINQALQSSNKSLQFSVDTDTQQTVVKMVDTSTGELIRQFPSETTLAISREIEQLQQGLLFKQQA